MNVFQGECLIVHFEDLKKDLRQTMKQIVNFLTKVHLSSETLECVNANSEGMYHRVRSRDENFDPFSSIWKVKLRSLAERVSAEMQAAVKKDRCKQVEV